MKHFFSKCILFCALFFQWSILAQMQFESIKHYGYIDCLVFDAHVENKVYASTNQNHILYSNNKGVDWNVLYSYPSNTFLSGLTYNSVSQTLSFMAFDLSSGQTGNSYYSIFTLDIASQQIVHTYQVPLPPLTISTPGFGYLTYERVFHYDINPGNPQDIIIYQRYDYNIPGEDEFGDPVLMERIIRSNNGGIHWENVLVAENYSITDIKISRANPNKIFYSSFNGLYATENNGQDWEQVIVNYSLHCISINPSDSNDIMLATTDGMQQDQLMFRSNDNGNTWNTLNLNWNESWGLKSIEKIIFNPTLPNTILILEEDEIAITHDNGLIWNHYEYPDYSAEDYLFGRYASFNPFQSNEVFIGTMDYLFFSTDSGATLTFHRLPFLSTVRVLKYPDHNHLYYSTDRGLLYKNLQTSEHFSYLPNLDEYFNSTSDYYINPYVTGMLYAYEKNAMASLLHVSYDHGANFDMIYFENSYDFGALYCLKVNPFNFQEFWASIGHGEEINLNKLIKFTLNESGTISSTEITVPGIDLILDIEFSTLIPGEVYVTDGITVKKSINGGETWTSISQGISLNPNSILYDIAINPFQEQQMIVTSNEQMFMTHDGGQQWNVAINDKIRETRFSDTTPGHIIASVYSTSFELAKLYYSIDSGMTWTSIPREVIEFVNASTMDYHFTEEGVIVYIATGDLGVVSFELDFSSLSTPEYPEMADDISVYPNPVMDKLNIHPGNQTILSISLYDSSGKQISTTSNVESIEVSSLQNGLYFLKIQTENNHAIIKKIVKK